MPAVRDLVRHLMDYAARITGEADLLEKFYPDGSFESFLIDLPNVHARPKGAILVVEQEQGQILGCVMLIEIAPDTTEIRRMIVSQVARGKGAGRALVTAAVAQARADGYARVILDTSKKMIAAQKAYEAAGFRRVPAPADAPDFKQEGAVFYALDLAPAA